MLKAKSIPFIPAIVAFLIIAAFVHGSVYASSAAQQDTVEISFSEFMELALERSKELQARRQSVGMAQARESEVKASRFLPNFEITTAHGLVPGVSGSGDFSNSQLYLDPSLRNDWEDWAFFNQFEVTALQPLYTWGAIRSAVRASQAAVDIASFEYEGDQRNTELQLFQLYQGRLLAVELKRLVDDAERTLRMAEEELQELFDEGSAEIDDADYYQFEIFIHQFESQVEEVNRNLEFLERAWALALGSREFGVVYLPAERFLDPLESEISSVEDYLVHARQFRSEVQQFTAIREAAGHGMEATRAQRYPALFIGANYRFAYASNRPRQRNPFISNPANTSALTVGLGIRQNLNFFVLNSREERSRLQYRQADYALEAIKDGVELDVNDKYKDALVARSRIESTSRALEVSRNWLRQEQLDYDIGFGDVTNLAEALRANLELEAELQQRTYEFNMRLARLLNASGYSLNQFFMNND
ncbi:MAG: TolC family protein [Balneolia bacterium]|nr:TolC family protein [Balneolia bacterium]